MNGDALLGLLVWVLVLLCGGYVGLIALRFMVDLLITLVRVAATVVMVLAIAGGLLALVSIVFG